VGARHLLEAAIFASAYDQAGVKSSAGDDE